MNQQLLSSGIKKDRSAKMPHTKIHVRRYIIGLAGLYIKPYHNTVATFFRSALTVSHPKWKTDPRGPEGYLRGPEAEEV